MKPRLIILLVLAGALALAFATRSTSPPVEGTDSGLSPAEKAELETLHSEQLLVWQFPLAGDEPEEEPEFDVNVRVDTSTGHNRLVLEVTEQHGYYVEFLKATVWYADDPEVDPSDAPLSVAHVLNRYLKSGDTLVECIEMVPAELRSIGGSIGESDHWFARIDHYTRARVADPSELPPVGGTNRCDN